MLVGARTFSRVNGILTFISACQGLYELTLKINTEEDGDSFLTSTLGTRDLFKLLNQTAAYWVGTSLGWLASGWGARSLYILFYFGVPPFELGRGWYFPENESGAGRKPMKTKPRGELRTRRTQGAVLTARSGRSAKLSI